MGFLPLTPRYTQLLATGGSASSGAGAEPADDPLATYAVFATVAFTLAIFLFKNYLSLRQRSTFHRTEFPSELSTTVGSIDAARAKEPKRKAEGGPSAGAGEEGGGGADPTSKVDRNAPLLPHLESKFAAAQSYGLDKVNFSLASSTYSTAEGVAFLLLGFMPYVWDRSVEFGARFFGWTERENEIGISLVFFAVTTVVGTVTGLPWELYSTFRIEKKHGFNKTTIGLFAADKIKGLALTAALGGPFVALLLKIIRMGGARFHVYVWAVTCAFSVFMMTIFPVVVMPLFNKYARSCRRGARPGMSWMPSMSVDVVLRILSDT